MLAGPRPSFVRATTARLAIAGTAGLASILTIAPAAYADVNDDLAPASEPTVTGQDEAAPNVAEPVTPDPAPVEPAVETDTTAEDAGAPGAVTDEPATAPDTPAPDPEAKAPEPEAVAAVEHGPQKFRIGVKIAEDAYVPAGTTSAGTVLYISYLDTEGNQTADTCTTEGEPDADGVTYCGAATEFLAPAGTTVTVSYIMAAEGLTYDPVSSRTLQPCEITGPGETCPTTDIIFTSPSVGPDPYGDQAATPLNTPILIDVLANDISADPTTTIAVAQNPTSGTAEVVLDGGRQKIRYTPNSDYNGRDYLSYSVTNRNGTASAGVGIEVGEVQPVYGEAKYRVGVQIADGSFVAPGTSTAGSEFTVTETMPDGSSTSFTCVTQASIPGPYPSFCPQERATAGATVTVVQSKAAPGLVRSTETLTLPPCEYCGGPFDSAELLLFTDTGPLPVAKDDTATTDEGESVRIDVLANDDSADPATTLAIDSRPDDGHAKIVDRPSVGVTTLAVPSGGSLAIAYTPDENFSGTDTFDYALTNSNGTATATVTVDVVDGQVVHAEDNGPDELLPDTGGADARLLGFAGLLLAMGGWLTARGRREHDVHAD